MSHFSFHILNDEYVVSLKDGQMQICICSMLYVYLLKKSSSKNKQDPE